MAPMTVARSAAAAPHRSGVTAGSAGLPPADRQRACTADIFDWTSRHNGHRQTWIRKRGRSIMLYSRS
eukprot:1273069-Pleurochrysis_carterae.AAC.1